MDNFWSGYFFAIVLVVTGLLCAVNIEEKRCRKEYNVHECILKVTPVTQEQENVK